MQADFTEGYDLGQIEKTALALGLVPKEQVTQGTVSGPEIATGEKTGAWERFYIFLTGLFA